MIDYEKHKAKPIIVDGVLFRSKLEATWSIFFNYMGWEWEYEPAIASGIFKGWLPDFVLHTSHSKPIYCEVKPVSESDDIEEFKTKIIESCIELDNVYALILGISPFSSRLGRNCVTGMGWLSAVKNGVWQQWQTLTVEHICDYRYLEFDSTLLKKTFEGKWSAAQNKIKEGCNWSSGHESIALMLLDMSQTVSERQRFVIDYNR